MIKVSHKEALELAFLKREVSNMARSYLELHALLVRYRDETPLGNQPHMIALLADEALGRDA